jgi:hypothetical protein
MKIEKNLHIFLYKGHDYLHEDVITRVEAVIMNNASQYDDELPQDPQDWGSALTMKDTLEIIVRKKRSTQLPNVQANSPDKDHGQQSELREQGGK